jgi:hypothetical protein
MSSLTQTLFMLLLVFFSREAQAKKRLRRSLTPSVTPTPTPTIAPLSEAHTCSQEGPFTLINVFLNPSVPRKGDKVTLSVFYYAPVEVENPDLIFAFQIKGKTFIHKSSLCENKLTKQEIKNRHLDEEQIPQDDNDEFNNKPQRGDDDSDIHPAPPCRIRAGEHMDNIDITWLYEANPPLDITMLYGHEKTPLLCAKVSIALPKNALRH